MTQCLDLYDQCLAFDPLNQPFNITIHYNKACALNKLGRNEDSIKALDQAIELDKEYTKAYLKKGDILLQLE